MNDTSPEIAQKQFEIYQSKSLDEKFRMITDMMEFGVNQTKTVVKQWYPNKSELELRIAFFQMYYRDDFGQEKMNWMITQMRKSA